MPCYIHLLGSGSKLENVFLNVQIIESSYYDVSRQFICVGTFLRASNFRAFNFEVTSESLPSYSADELLNRFIFVLFQVEELDNVAEFVDPSDAHGFHQLEELLLGGGVNAGAVVVALSLQAIGHARPELIQNILAG